jgi:hypothetical protein
MPRAGMPPGIPAVPRIGGLRERVRTARIGLFRRCGRGAAPARPVPPARHVPAGTAVVQSGIPAGPPVLRAAGAPGLRAGIKAPPRVARPRCAPAIAPAAPRVARVSCVRPRGASRRPSSRTMPPGPRARRIPGLRRGATGLPRVGPVGGRRPGAAVSGLPPARPIRPPAGLRSRAAGEPRIGLLGWGWVVVPAAARIAPVRLVRPSTRRRPARGPRAALPARLRGALRALPSLVAALLSPGGAGTPPARSGRAGPVGCGRGASLGLGRGVVAGRRPVARAGPAAARLIRCGFRLALAAAAEPRPAGRRRLFRRDDRNRHRGRPG